MGGDITQLDRKPRTYLVLWLINRSALRNAYVFGGLFGKNGGAIEVSEGT